MKKRILLVFVMLFVICFSVFSQENGQQESTEQQQVSSDYPSDSIFVINSFVFDVDGITLPFVMISKADLIKGEEIKGHSNLLKYIETKRQILYNERVLESVSIDHSIGAQKEDGKHPVDLVIHVKDTHNIMAIPRPLLDSNSGFDITIKARDYNFLGTMNALRVDFGYKYDEKGRNHFTFMLDSGIPFEAFGLEWNFDFDHYVNYRPDMAQKYYYKNVTGLSAALPIKRTTFLIGFSESLIYNEENPDAYKFQYGDFQDGVYMSSNPYVFWGIPTGLEIGDYGELTYTPGFSAIINHEFSQWPLDDYKKGTSLVFSHSLGFGRVNWIGNFRRGYSASANNFFTYSFYNKQNNLEPLAVGYGISAEGHFIVTDAFGISSRLMFQSWYNTANESAGNVLRGVKDNHLYADYIVSLNLDIRFRILRFMPSEWLNNRKLRFFNFELHFGPIMDAALSHDPRPRNGNIHGTVYGFNNLNIAGGFELIVFPLSFRSLFLRGSIATDAYRMLIAERGPVEYYIGVELHY